MDDRYLSQARFAAETLGLEIEFQKCSVYEVDRVPGTFDLVLFMGAGDIWKLGRELADES